VSDAKEIQIPLPERWELQRLVLHLRYTVSASLLPETSTLAISGTVDTRTLRYNLFGNAVTSIVNADGRQPDTDGEQQGFARVFATLPPTGTAPQLGASWTIGLPSALEARLTAQTADDTSSTRPTFSGQITGLVDLDDPSDFAIVRATISVKRWATRPPSIPGPIGPQPGLVSVGVADLAVGTGPTFTGIVPLRAAYFGQPGVTMPDGIDWRVVAAGPHTTDLYCLTADDAGVPASVIAAIPDIVDAPYPAAFDSCTH